MFRDVRLIQQKGGQKGTFWYSVQELEGGRAGVVCLLRDHSCLTSLPFCPSVRHTS